MVRRLGWRLRVLQLRQAHLVGDMQRLRGVSELSAVLVHNRHDPRQHVFLDGVKLQPIGCSREHIHHEL